MSKTAYKQMMKTGTNTQNSTQGMSSQSINNKGGKTLNKTVAHPAHSKSGLPLKTGQPIVKGKGRTSRPVHNVAKGE